jgi:lipopolysaccharide N-acetylglucosaminyltransferase
LVQLYHSPEKLEEFSKNGKKIVEKYYSKAAFIQQYREIYDEMGRL